jgi:PKHD-type hydroxylase
MVKNAYWLWSNVLSKAFCDLVIAEMDWTKQEEGGFYHVGHSKIEVDHTMRKTLVCYPEFNSPIGCVAQTYIQYANKEAGWNFVTNSYDTLQVVKYEDGGHVNWHLDPGEISGEQDQRKLSFVMLLSDPSEYEGGLLEFKGFPEQPKLGQGSIIVFPSFIEHRVTPVTSGIRYSAVTWACGPSFK